MANHNLLCFLFVTDHCALATVFSKAFHHLLPVQTAAQGATLPNKGHLWPNSEWNPRSPANILSSPFNVTQTGYACQYANAFRDSNRFYPVQNVTAGIACHILLNRIHLD
jgi:hypothetical protein